MSNGGLRFFAAFLAVTVLFLLVPRSGFAQFGWAFNTKKTVAEQAPQNAAAAPKSAPRVVKTETSQIGNWLLTCADFDDPAVKRACTAKLQILQPQNNAVAFVWEIGVTNDRSYASVMHVPTGVLIDPGIQLKIGKSAPRKINFHACAQMECTAEFPINEKLVKEIAANASVEASIVAVSGATVNFQIRPNRIDMVFEQIQK